MVLATVRWMPVNITESILKLGKRMRRQLRSESPGLEVGCCFGLYDDLKSFLENSIIKSE